MAGKTNAAPQPASVLRIKRYANRRLYDSTRSCDVTLPELQQLICDGHEIHVTDVKTGDDITNAVLMHIILDRDAAKLTVFPPAILHQVIRTQQAYLGGIFEQFLRQAIASQHATAEQWRRFVENTFGSFAAPPADAAEWMRRALDPFNLGGREPQAPDEPRPSTPPATEAEVSELRRRLAELTQRVEALDRGGPHEK